MLAHTLAVSAVLLAIILTGRFVKYLAEAASGKLAADILLPVMFYRLPGFLELLIPLGLFIGILMAYGRLYVESEMVILGACGAGPGRLARFTLAAALPVSAVVAVLSLYLTPQGAARSEALLNSPRALQGVQFLAAGRFQLQSDDGAVSYAAGIDADAGTLRQVFLYEPERAGEPPSVTFARRGEVVRDRESGARYLELQEGYRYSGAPGRRPFQIASFERYGLRLPDDPDLGAVQPVDARATALLLASSAAEDRAALHWRLSLVAMVPIVALLALALAKTEPRRGRYFKLAPALLVHLAYLFALASMRGAMAEERATAPQLWAVHGGFLLLAGLLLFGPDRWRRWRRRA